MTTDEEILLELKKIVKIITISNGDKLEKELESVANNDDRKKILCLIDGKRKTEDIAKLVNKTKRAVEIFLDQLEEANFIEERKYGIPPKKIVDWTPSSWVELLNKPSKEKTKERKI